MEIWFTPFAMADVKVYHSQFENVFTSIAIGQSLKKSKRMGLHSLLMMDVKSARFTSLWKSLFAVRMCLIKSFIIIVYVYIF